MVRIRVRKKRFRTTSKLNKDKRVTNNIANQPPLVSFNRVFSSTILRGSVRLNISPDTMNSLDFVLNSKDDQKQLVDILSEWTTLSEAFKEVKIKKVNVWITSFSSKKEDGMLATIIHPIGQAVKGLVWRDFVCTQGSMVRKIYETTYGTYFPTEPSERNWFSLDSSIKKLFTVSTMMTGIHVGNTTPRQFDLVWDAHVEYRGRSSTAAKCDCDINPNPIVRSSFNTHRCILFNK